MSTSDLKMPPGAPAQDAVAAISEYGEIQPRFQQVDNATLPTSREEVAWATTWRHTFKTRALAVEMPEWITDAPRHAARTVGRTYGSVPLETMAAAIGWSPRFATE